MAVAPVWMRSLRILIFTISDMTTRLTASINRFTTLLPMSSMNINANIEMPVTIRNIRSCRLTLWSKMISNHFFITQCFLLIS